MQARGLAGRVVHGRVLDCSVLRGVLSKVDGESSSPGHPSELSCVSQNRPAPVSLLGSVLAGSSPQEAWPVVVIAEGHSWSCGQLRSPLLGMTQAHFHSCHLRSCGLETRTQRSAVGPWGGPSVCTRLQLTQGVPRVCMWVRAKSVSSPPNWDPRVGPWMEPYSHAPVCRRGRSVQEEHRAS